MLEIDWHQLFGFETSIAELVLRGTTMYWFLFVLFRFVMRRDVGAIGIADVLLIVIIADASQNAIDGGYRSITEGMVVVATLVAWNLVTNWLNYHWEPFARLAEPPPLLLIRNGKVLGRNMRREMITLSELMSKLREQSIERVEEVRWACMESDGQISLQRYREPERKPRHTEKPPAPVP